MNKLFKSLFGEKHLEEYCSGVFSDELDKLGYKNQVVSNWKLNNSNLRLFGKVRTLMLETIETNDERINKGLGFLGSLDTDDVLLVKGSNDYAYFGELMSRLSQEIGLAGAIIDGLTRDTFYTQNIELPILAKGYTPVDIKGRGRVDETDITVNVESVKVKPGDYVFADNDAVVFIPATIIGNLIPKVLEAVEEEAEIKVKIKNGTPISEILLKHKSF